MSLAVLLPPSRAPLSSRATLRGTARLTRPPPANRVTRRPKGRPPLVVSPDACWSLEVSLATSAFVASTVAVLLKRGDRRSIGHAMFLGVFGSMQLVDASLWWNDAHSSLGSGLGGCDLTNRVSTRAGLAIICLEPMAAMLGAHVVAGKRAPPALIAAYAGIFLLTPLAGTSLLSEKPPCFGKSPSTDAAAAVPSSPRAPPLFEQTGMEASVGFASSQTGSGAPPRFGGGGIAAPATALATATAPASTCSFSKSWSTFLFNIDDPCVCSAVTPEGHLQYGGLDLVYHQALAPWDPVEPCRLKATGEVIEGSREIPLALRFLFLGAMALPYGLLVTPQKAGASHAGILTATWLIGAGSDAAASVWCLANVAQGILMLAEPAIWPDEFDFDFDDEFDFDEEAPGSSIGSPAVPSKKKTKRRRGTIVRAVKKEDEGRPLDPDADPSKSPVDRISRFKPDAGRRWPRLDKAAAAKLSADPNGFDAIVIGSGVGGLACAAVLAKFGDKKVLVLESHYRAGGCTHAFNEVGDGGDVFDTGIHYVGMGQTLRWLISRITGTGHAPMRFAAMGDVSDGYAYDVFDLGERPGGEKTGTSSKRQKSETVPHTKGPSGWGTSADLDCDDEVLDDDDDYDLENYLDELELKSLVGDGGVTSDDLKTILKENKGEDPAWDERVKTILRTDGGNADRAARGGDERDEVADTQPERVVVTLRKDRLIESLCEVFPRETEGINAYVTDVRLGASRFTEHTDSGAALHESMKWFRFPVFNPGLDALMAGKLIPVSSLPIVGWSLAAIRTALFKKAERGAERTATDVVSKYVTDPAAIATLAAGQMIDYNLPPGQVAWPVSAGMMSYYDGGGYYPVGGSAQIAESIANAIESNNDSLVLCNAKVDRVLVTESGSKHRAYGVKVNGVEIHAPVVISACGFETTFRKLVPRSTLNDTDLMSGIDQVTGALKPSHGHVCAYVSLDGTSEELGLRPANIHSFPEDFGTLWNFDVDKMCAAFYADPLNVDPLVTITSPSAKDAWYKHERPGRSNALLLIEGLAEWFRPFEEERWGRRSDSYREFKSKFKNIFLERLYRHYPKTKGRVTHIELSTPLTTEYFIGAPGGASYGLEWTKEHFNATFHEKYFSPVVSQIPGMFLTGEAIAFGGFYGALANGVVTASHVMGIVPLLAGMLGDKKAVWPLVYEDGEEPPPPVGGETGQGVGVGVGAGVRREG